MDGAIRLYNLGKYANNGVFYWPEKDTTDLMLVFNDTIDVLKQIARNPKNYSVSIVLTELHNKSPSSWGYFKEDALLKNNWDCETLRRRWEVLGNTKQKQPGYFVTKVATMKDEIPEITMATMKSLIVYDNRGKAIGGYNCDLDNAPVAWSAALAGCDKDLLGKYAATAFAAAKQKAAKAETQAADGKTENALLLYEEAFAALKSAQDVAIDRFRRAVACNPSTNAIEPQANRRFSAGRRPTTQPLRN